MAVAFAMEAAVFLIELQTVSPAEANATAPVMSRYYFNFHVPLSPSIAAAHYVASGTGRQLAARETGG
jgi:hypothetical protein